jgi:hypothetical protein
VVTGNSGDVIFVPKGISHISTVGDKGGNALVISSPYLEMYFWKIFKFVYPKSREYKWKNHSEYSQIKNKMSV